MTPPRDPISQNRAEGEPPDHERPAKRRKLSADERTFIETLTSIAPGKLYELGHSTPARELQKDEFLALVRSMRERVAELLSIGGQLDESTIAKARDSDEPLREMDIEFDQYEDDEDKIQRYFAYELDGSAAGLAMITEDRNAPGQIYVDGIVSHPGVRRAASALLEAIMWHAGKNPDITLRAIDGAVAAYQRLGFQPQAHLMRLQPHLSDDWELRSGHWHYIPDGDTYLVSATRPERHTEE